MKPYASICEAIADPNSNIARSIKRAETVKQENDQAIAAWMAKGYSREDAYRAALFGFRK